MIQLLGPKISAFIVLVLLGRPDLVDDLHAICQRESRCTVIGPHDGDAKYGRPEWYGQVSWGHLDPECQPLDIPGGWATRGSFGLSAGAHWQYMPECYDPRSFDIPLVSAYVAAQKYIRRCEGKKTRRGWCHVPKKVRTNNRI